MGDFSRKLKSDNAHLASLTSARYAHVAASTTKTVCNGPGNLQRVVLNTNGGAVIVRDGTDVIANIASDAPETTFEYGIYCDNSIIVETGATCDVTVVFDR